MTYVSLGSRQKPGALDTGNGGNWTVAFTPQDLVVNVPEYEVYHISISGPAGSGFTVYQNMVFFDNVLRGDVNSWNPPQPLIMRPGDQLFFYWNSSDAPKPLVSLFLRYDPAAQALSGMA